MAATATGPAKKRLAIFLHGLGDSGFSFHRFNSVFRDTLPELEWHTPTATKRDVTLSPYGRMTAWFDLSELPVRPTTPTDAAGLEASTKLVHGWIDKAGEAGIAASDVFLCGFSQGAALALHAGTQYPSALGGIIAFAGWLPGPLTIASAQASASTRVLLLHGSHDSKVLGILSESARDVLSAKGLSVTRVEFEGDHELGPDALNHMRAFFSTSTHRHD